MSVLQDEQPYLQLSVWVPARVPGTLMSYASSEIVGLTTDQLNLYEQVYSWASKEDIWAGIREATTITRAREMLSQDFAPTLPPEERGFDRFQELILELEKLCNDAEWTDCLQGGPEERYRANHLLVVKNHFDWVYRLFRNLPGASVTLR